MATVKVDLPKKLPEPDPQYGTYWLGQKPSGPAIFESREKAHNGKWFASLGQIVDGLAVLSDKNAIRYFDSPEEALKAMRQEAGKAASLRGGL